MDPNQPTAGAAPVCAKCGGTTTGYKCDMCGAQSDMHDDQHACGGEHCVAKCAGCNEAESKCTCPPATVTTGGEPAAPAA